MIKLVIFDFDDTLIENMELDYHSFVKSSKKLNGYIPTKKEIKSLRSHGLLASEIIDWIKNKSSQSFNKNEFKKIRNEFLQSNTSIKYLVLRPYVKKLLFRLKSMKIKVVIVSLRKKKYTVRNFLRKKKILNYFDEIFNAEDSVIDTRKTKNAIMIKSKLFHKVLCSYEIKPTEILSIGDSKVDLHTAKKYGVNYITITKKYIRDKYSNAKIHSFNELIKLIGKGSKIQ
mgnify:CR=1 FL=1